MSMKVVFLKPMGDYEAGWEGFVPRSLGSRLCYQEIVVPYSIKDHHAGYKAMIKEKEKAKREAEREAEKKEKAESEAKEKAELKALKKKVVADRKTTTSKKVETRETATI